MSDHHEEIRRLAKKFESCQKILLALGDENRRHRMPERMRTEDCGVRVGTIAERPTQPALRYRTIYKFSKTRAF